MYTIYIIIYEKQKCQAHKKKMKDKLDNKDKNKLDSKENKERNKQLN